MGMVLPEVISRREKQDQDGEKGRGEERTRLPE